MTLRFTNFPIPPSFGKKTIQVYFVSDAFTTNISEGKRKNLMEVKIIDFESSFKVNKSFKITLDSKTIDQDNQIQLEFQIPKIDLKVVDVTIRLGKSIVVDEDKLKDSRFFSQNNYY